MRLLLDQNLSPALAELLTTDEHDAVHVRDLGLSRATDEVVLAAALDADRILISSDTDFGDLLSRTNAAGPSVVLLRRQAPRRALGLAALILANLDAVTDDLRTGAIVVLDADRVRVRPLPMTPDA